MNIQKSLLWMRKFSLISSHNDRKEGRKRQRASTIIMTEVRKLYFGLYHKSFLKYRMLPNALDLWIQLDVSVLRTSMMKTTNNHNKTNSSSIIIKQSILRDSERKRLQKRFRAHNNHIIIICVTVISHVERKPLCQWNYAIYCDVTSIIWIMKICTAYVIMCTFLEGKCKVRIDALATGGLYFIITTIFQNNLIEEVDKPC